MRKTLVLFGILLASLTTFAQSIELTPLFGYTVAGKVDSYNRYFNVHDDMLYGGLLSVEFDDYMFVDLSYQRNDTKGNTRLTEVDLGVEHYQVGLLREFGEGQVIPFAKVSLGTSRYIKKSGGKDSYWLFSGGFGAGAKIFVNEKVGFRLFTNLMLPMEFDGGGFWCGIGTGGSGCSGGIHFNVPLVHWDMGIGLIINLPG